MSVVSVRELWKGRGGKSDFFAHGDSKRVWRVVTNNSYDDEFIVGQAVDPNTGVAIPKPFDAHPTRLNLWAKEADARNEDVSSYLWIVFVDYTSELPDKAISDQNPMARGWIDEFSAVRYQAPAIQGSLVDPVTGAEANQQTAIVNSAGDPFDPPPEMDASRLLISLRINLDSVPQWILLFQDAVNDAPVTIRGITFPAGTLKANVGIGPIEIDNSYYYRQLSLELEYRWSTWNGIFLDRGFNYRVSGKPKKITVNGSEPTQPFLLKNGQPLGLVQDGAMSSSSTTVTSASGNFSPADVGNAITVKGAGASGADLLSTIAAYVSDTNLTLADAAGTTVTAAQVNWISTPQYRNYRIYQKQSYAPLNLPAT